MADFADEWGPRLKEAIAEEAPVRTGQLRDSIYNQRHISARSADILIKSNVPQARFVTQGTKPHDIYPVNARVLHWEDSFGDHFAMHVWHPGTKPNPFPQRGAATIKHELARAIQMAALGAVGVAA